MLALRIVSHPLLHELVVRVAVWGRADSLKICDRVLVVVSSREIQRELIEDLFCLREVDRLADSHVGHKQFGILRNKLRP